MRRISLVLCVLWWSLPTVGAQARPPDSDRTGGARAIATPSSAGAKPSRHDARTERLGSFTQADLARIAPQLAHGPVALIEFADTEADQLPGIHIAAFVNAPADTVLDAVRRPDAYPKFMRTLDEVVIIGGSQDALIYDWRWELGVLSFAGRNQMAVHRPPQSRADEGYRVTIDSQRGDLGAGRMLIRIVPRGPKASTLVVSMRVDLRTANYVARQLARAARSINRSSNIALAYAMLLGFQHEAERRVGFSPPERPKPAFAAPQVALGTVAPLLLRGDLVLLDVSGPKLNHLAVLGLVHQPQAMVREVMLDAKAFGASLMPGSSARVVGKENDVTTFEWAIDLPLVGIEGTMRVREREPIEIEAIEGALEGGRWVFATKAVSKDATLVTAWADFDLKRSTWLLRGLIETDRNLGHGLSAASEVMLLRAVRSRSRKHAEKLAAKAPEKSAKSEAR